ncbi:MAG: hypothetical protein ISS45_12015 [Candidatus Omnitrophica bacterium]|nr:hypothetical protein [Candidatus Omnitrophota bacterium]
MQSKPIIRLIIRISLVFAASTIFFLGYNRFLVDHSLNNLKLALGDVKKNQLEGVSKILAQTVIEELTKTDPEIETYMALEYAKNVVSSHEKGRSLNDVKLMMQDIIKKKEQKRGRVLNVLDNISNTTVRALRLQPGIKKIAMKREKIERRVIDFKDLERRYPVLKQYKDAVKNREAGNYEEAAKIYLEIAKNYKYSAIAPTVLFQAGSTYQFDLKDEKRAAEVFEKISKDYPITVFSYKRVTEVETPAWMQTAPIRVARKGIRLVGDRCGVLLGERIVTEMRFLQKGERVTHEVTILITEELMTGATKRINTKLAGKPVKVERIEFEFNRDGTMGVKGKGSIAGIDMNVDFTGRVELKERAGGAWLVYNVIDANISGIPIDPLLINRALEKGHSKFNAKVPFQVTAVEIEPGEGVLITGRAKGD